MTVNRAIKVLTKRAAWLTERIEAAQEQGLAYSFDAEERAAIHKIIAIARERLPERVPE